MVDRRSDISTTDLLQDFRMSDLREAGPGRKGNSGDGIWNSLIFISGGDALLQIDFDEFIALEGRVFLIEKYRIWNWGRINKVTGFMVQFTDSFYNFIYTGNQKLKSDQILTADIPPFIRIDKGEKAEWETISGILHKEYTGAGMNSREVICLLLKVLILMYRRNSHFSDRVYESRQKKQLLNDFRGLVNSRFIELRTAKDYALELNITPNYLNSLCQEYFARTVSEIIRERMILEAKRLIMHSKLDIAEIGFKLGFTDNSYFGRYFKKAVGLTPKSFRELCSSTADV